MFSLSGALLSVLLALASTANAQSLGKATLDVTMRTDQGAPVSGATVTVRSPGGFSQNGTTGPSGEIRFDDLAPGSYKVSISANGFSELMTEIYLAAAEEQRLDAIVSPGTARTDSITVQGAVEAPLEQSLSTPVTLEAAQVKHAPARPTSVVDALPHSRHHTLAERAASDFRQRRTS
jgi:hypothetical protein